MTQRDDRRDDEFPTDDSFGERDGFGDLGEFGVSSAELPQVHPGYGDWRAAWAKEQRVRATSMDTIHALWEAGILSEPGYDLLQVELEQGVPWLAWDTWRKLWRVWSAVKQRWYTLPQWEALAQELLPIADPNKQTAILLRQDLTPPPDRYWHPAFDSNYPRYTPPPQLRVTRPPMLTDPHAEPSRTIRTTMYPNKRERRTDR